MAAGERRIFCGQHGKLSSNRGRVGARMKKRLVRFVLCTLCFVLRTWYFAFLYEGVSARVQSTKHKVQSTKLKAQSTKYKVQSFKHKAQSTKHKAQSTKHTSL